MIQEQFINALLKRQDPSIITVNNITAEYLSDYKDEFAYILNHLKTYGKLPDIETFVAKYPDFDIIEVNEPTNYLIDELMQDRNERFLAKTFNDIRLALSANEVSKALSIYKNSQDQLNHTTHMSCVDLFSDTSRFDAYVERSKDFEKYYVSTGFRELDKLIGGWDRKEELGVMIAPTNNGKTWLLLKSAIAAAEQGLTVGIYSGEMTDRKVGYRIDTLISHISNSCINHGNLDIQNEYKRYLDTIKEKIPGTIKVLTPAMINCAAGVQILQGFIEKEKLDMLCIDQHSLLEDDRGAKNPVERASNISRDLKNLQTLKQIPIIAVAQQNRTSDDETTGDKSRVAASYRIVQDATIAINAEQKDGIMTLILTKSRDSSNNKKLKYSLNLDKGLFTYIPEETDGVGGEGSEALRQEFDENPGPGDNVF